MTDFCKSHKLADVCYDIRGPVLDHANWLEEQGQKIIKLNIGNPGAFGFDAPDEIIHDVIHNLRDAQGYSHSKGLFSARKAVMQRYQAEGIENIDIEDVIMGNGVSELIIMAMQALLNPGDEILIPSPDYPLWTAAVSMGGGKPVHYDCDEDNDWQPNIGDIESKITANTRGIVIINPNNPTGAVYSQSMLNQLVAIAERHNLIVFADEIYDRIVYDDAKHIPMASLVKNVLCLTFNGLSKTYRLAGFRSGWMLITGAKKRAKSYIEGLEMLASMRLCANAPAMLAVQTALGGRQSIEDLILPGGRLLAQRDLAHKLITEIPGVSCVKPKSAMYLFPKLDPTVYPITDDEDFILRLLKEERILMVQGSAFNLADQQHFRIVFLPDQDQLRESIARLANFLARLRA
ncbi:MAG: pyridoxal phosphate-dependent aminotransferase [Porticoccaceae bacterium]|jgi:alanine-synthesizing transaminase|nr:pyridoxal phosphate-dependent aminotransferase [Porticoccaceae bacterium]MBT5577688.1 pyridoxal phosphate-dependent aminotransferase [Porticoccaceae bacterium]MBT7376141.1 pyridoxal phosphate-dependent aminotransferase [Porticoccaceae bacterium]